MNEYAMKQFSRRLKELRIQHGYSHAQVCQLILEQFHISISPSSLAKYESENPGKYRAGSSRMNIEFLDCFARLYNVSTDYLLCRTDVEWEDNSVRDIVDKTGLSENTIKLLISAKQSHDSGIDNKDSRYRSLERFSKYIQASSTSYAVLDKTTEEYSYDIFYYLETLLDAYVSDASIRRNFAYLIREYKIDYDHIYRTLFPTDIDLQEISKQLLIKHLVNHLEGLCHLEDQEQDGILFELKSKFDLEDKLFPEDTDPFY